MYKILYVDDNTSLLKLFQCLGEEHGFVALTTKSIKESVDIALNEKPDVILLDINLGPNKNDQGWYLVTAFKTHEELNNIPIIACSVTYREEGKIIASIGNLKFINDKPYSLEKLNQILSGTLPPIETQ